MRRLVIAAGLVLAAAGAIAAVALTSAGPLDEAAPVTATNATDSTSSSASTSPTATSTGPPSPRELLPDLDQAVPENLSIFVDPDGNERLTFLSAVDNDGDGALVIKGRRSPLQETMNVRQVVALEDGSSVSYAIRSKLSYVRSETHEHWHLLGFERYELWSRNGSLLSGDRKTGFCLGDRYDSKIAEPSAQPPSPVYVGNCGKGQPARLSIRQGISPGYGDDYVPILEGQYVDVSDVPTGRYVLVHRANPERDVRESDYENNASSVLIRLRRPPGAKPIVTVLASCPDTPTCA